MKSTPINLLRHLIAMSCARYLLRDSLRLNLLATISKGAL